MKELNLNKRTEIAVTAAQKASQLLLDEIGEDKKILSIEAKGENDFVTRVDKASQKLLIEIIKEEFPEDFIIAEEGEHSPERDSGVTWIIDPLDGTTNFIHSLPLSSISIAYKEEGELRGGIVYQPFLKELFIAEKGKGAYLNGKKIAVTQCDNPADALVAAAFPIRDFDHLKQYFNLQYNLIQQTHDIRRLGSAAIDLCYVACGRFDAYCELGLKIWDIAAGALILTEAGGTITDWDGKDSFWKTGSFVATNTKLHKWMLEQIDKHFFNIKSD